jgi:hypothetical protein
MNINYLRLPQMPRYEEGWQPVLDALRTGAFFTTTGEILIPELTIEGKRSGEVARIPSDRPASAVLGVDNTFPLEFIEVISGDGTHVFRERLDPPFQGRSTQFHSTVWNFTLDLKGRKWVRLEVWDTATNGAYTQPVWLE